MKPTSRKRVSFWGPKFLLLSVAASASLVFAVGCQKKYDTSSPSQAKQANSSAPSSSQSSSGLQAASAMSSAPRTPAPSNSSSGLVRGQQDVSSPSSGAQGSSSHGDDAAEIQSMEPQEALNRAQQLLDGRIPEMQRQLQDGVNSRASAEDLNRQLDAIDALLNRAQALVDRPLDLRLGGEAGYRERIEILNAQIVDLATRQGELATMIENQNVRSILAEPRPSVDTPSILGDEVNPEQDQEVPSAPAIGDGNQASPGTLQWQQMQREAAGQN